MPTPGVPCLPGNWKGRDWMFGESGSHTGLRSRLKLVGVMTRLLDFQTESLERYGGGSPCTAGDPKIFDEPYGSNHLFVLMRRLRDGHIDNIGQR